MARVSAPRCPLCGAEMREERGMGRENFGMVERWWTCPSCLHRETTIDSEGGEWRPEEGGQQCTSM